MGARGKQSATVHEVPTVKIDPIKPPLGTDRFFKKRWREIVSCYPTDFFMRSDVPLLTEYILNEQTLVELREIVQREGYTVGCDDKAKINPHMQAQMNLQRVQLALASRLRIAPSARDSQITRGTLKETQKPKSKRPMFGG